MTKCCRKAQHRLGQGLQRKSSASSILAVVLQLAELQQKLDGHRSARWRRVVGYVARACDKLLRVAGSIEEGADFIVPEPFDHFISNLSRSLHPLLVERQLIDGEKSKPYRRLVF